MWAEGSRYGSIDPCYPSKVAQAHIHNLLFQKHAKKKLDYIFFPCITHMPTFVDGHAGLDELSDRGRRAEGDAGGVHEGGRLLRARRHRVRRRRGDAARAELLRAADVRDVGRAARRHRGRERPRVPRGLQGAAAVRRGDGAPRPRDPRDSSKPRTRSASCCSAARTTSIPASITACPTSTRRSAIRCCRCDRSRRTRSGWRGSSRTISIAASSPRRSRSRTSGPRTTRPTASRRCGPRSSPRAIPNVVVLDLSSFKCGHDAPTYGLIDSIINSSGTPASALHDIDANKPGGSIKIRVKTYAHTLKRFEEELADQAAQRSELQRRVEAKAARAALATPRAAARRRARRSAGSRASSPSSRPPSRLPRRRHRRAGRPHANARSAARNDIAPPAPVARHGVSPQGSRGHTWSQADEQPRCWTTTRSNVSCATFEAEERRGSASRRSGRALARRQSADVHPRRSRDDDHPARRPDAGPRHAAHRRAGGTRLQAPGARLPGRRGAPLRQGVRQSRAVQPDVLHRRQPREAPDRTCATRRGCRAEEIIKQLRLPDRRRVRPVPVRHVRHRVPQGARRFRLRGLPRAAVPAAGRPEAGHRRSVRPRVQRQVLQGRRCRPRWRATASTSRAIASVPTR